ncbi:Cof-type HAD-IIB family hydrolase [Thorsellia anophelis]|uniref:Sugar/pyridoxal phosphate phosphatase YigL n=1 Tax=Thorsellia anophelis DSM 18579 TaxID=1123402 RepID=A0A1I0CT41_9GAMM|nr:Cof-type HAD-IIB family hydrolase [Thorsellia anophelis]SET22445.1 hypothetical protein SAMN02583745_01708 [Thorsellia anophelis DSM 18579]
MYSVIASDLDGTLLSNEHTLTPFARQTLQRMVAKDIKFIFATGRHHVDVNSIREGLGFDAFMITSNGARVHNKAGELIAAHNIDESLIDELLSVAKGYDDIYTHVYTGDKWYVDRDIYEEEDFFKDSKFSYEIYADEKVDKKDIFKIFYTAQDPKSLRPVEVIIESRFKGMLSMAHSSLNCFELMANGVSKGAALKEVLALKGYTLADCIAFGDGMNDVEMLSVVGKGHIMKNADPRLIAKLPHLEIIGSNSEDAVIQKIIEYFD